MKFNVFRKLKLLSLKLDPKDFGRIFAFVDYGNVQHWYDDDRRKADGTALESSEIFYVDIYKLGKFIDQLAEHKRFYYGHIASKPATLHIIAIARKCKFIKITKPVHRVRHYLASREKLSKKAVIRKDGLGKSFIYIPKCNFDVEITLDTIRRFKDYDTFLLFSSDRDFVKLLLYLKRKKKKIILVGGGYISYDLKKYADKVIHARDIKETITSVKKIKARL